MTHYLDYAATSAVRPDSVATAVSEFLTGCGATPGRGGHARALDAARTAFACRRALQRVLGVPGDAGDAGRIAFTLNATQALNTALAGTLRSGDAVVVSQFDHNAVLRPVDLLRERRGVEVRMLQGDPEGRIDLDDAERLLAGARLLVVNGASNVLGTALPIGALSQLAHAAGALVLVDAAQSAGHLPATGAEAGVDMIAVAGHKGLLGPQGTGALWVREGVEIDPLVSGGTGGNSEARAMPSTLPDRLEAGTQNAPGMAGLTAGISYLEDQGIASIHRRLAGLKTSLREGLDRIDGLEVVSPAAPDGVAIVMVRPRRLDPAELAGRLDREWGVMVRHGLHCAPEAHRVLGTLETGAVRYSLGWASSAEDVERALEATAAILAPTRVGAS